MWWKADQAYVPDCYFLMSKMDNFEVVDYKWQSHLQAV